MSNFLHGIEVQEIDSGSRIIKTAKSSVIGIIGTATDSDVPANVPILVTGSKLPETFGNTGTYDVCGTLPSAIKSIFDQIGAILIVVRVESEEDIAGGLGAFLASESTIHVTPRILIVPGFSGDTEVLTAIIPVAEKLKAIIVADASTGPKLGSTIKQLESSSKSIGKFQSLKQSILTAKNEWAQAEAQVKSLAVAMNQAGPDTAKLASEFEKSKNAASKAKQAYLEKRNALHNLSAKLRQSGVDMGSLGAEQTKLGTSIDKLKTKYNDLNALMQKRQGIIAQRAHLRGQIMDTVALGAAMAAPIKAAVNFESAMADVKKVVDFAEPDGLVKLGNTIKQMSRDIPISAEGLAQITAAGGQLGVKEKDLAAFTETVSKMSTAFDMLPDEAGQTMAQLSNVFQIPMQNVKGLGDAINHYQPKLVVWRDACKAVMRVNSEFKTQIS
ncbi:MAG: phage tail tape measure protein [Holosporales bacterium]|jgi:hypothetical protein|nr:phage tail tape measure protein [Holosporales bacterium]